MSRPAALNRRKSEDAELRRVAARLEREIAASGIDALETELKAEIKRLRNRNRMRCIRDGSWPTIRALEGLSAKELRAMIREKLRKGIPEKPQERVD